MDFLEQELRKIVPREYAAKTTFFSRTAFVAIGELNRARIAFFGSKIPNRYNSVKVTILNRNEGVVDSMQFRFKDLLKRKAEGGANWVIPNIRDGMDGETFEWQGRIPDNEDYIKLATEIGKYLGIFADGKQM